MLLLLSTWKMGVRFTLLTSSTIFFLVLICRRGYYEPSNLARQQHRDSYITDCITRRILGRIPDDMVTQLFDGEKIGESAETHQQRKESFRRVFNSREWIDDRNRPTDKEYQGIQASGK